MGVADPELAGAIDRAVTLADDGAAQAEADDEASNDTRLLAELHLSRQIGRIPYGSVADRAAGRGRVLAIAATALAAGGLAAIGLEPVRLIEGALRAS